MKMLLVLALGIAPLAVLTASSLFGRGPAITGAVLDDVKPVDLEEVADLAQAGADQAKKELALTQRLVDLEVFTDTPPALAIDGAGDRWKPIDKAWSDLKKAYDACSRLTKVYRLAPASAQAEDDALQAYL